MTTRDPSIVQAERLRVVMSMPEYNDTIGKWLDEAMQQALHDMTYAKPEDFAAHQGAYRALNNIKLQIERTFTTEEAAIKRELAKRKGKTDE